MAILLLSSNIQFQLTGYTKNFLFKFTTLRLAPVLGQLLYLRDNFTEEFNEIDQLFIINNFNFSLDEDQKKIFKQKFINYHDTHKIGRAHV